MLNQFKIKILFCLPFIFIAGCADLDIQNPNEPDKDRALTSPSDIESLIGGAFNTFWYATENWTPTNGLSVVADEHTSSWGNAAMKDLSSEPRVKFDNSTSYIDIGHLETPWYGLYSAVSSVNDALSSILDAENPIEIGIDGADTKRAVAFGRFIQGISFCYLGAFFDQAFILDETTDMEGVAAGTVEMPLKLHSDVMAAGIAHLEACITLCEANTFTLPSSWINGMELTNAQLARVAHSYIARYTACVARTPAERAAVDWAAVESHVDDGITDGEDFGPYADVWTNWYSWYREISYLDSWTRVDYKTIGTADTSGNYTAWLNTPVADRQPFNIHTADRRITGDTPDSAGLYFSHAGEPWFRPDRGTYHFSYYNFDRWEANFVDGVDQLTTMWYEEMQLLKAEALYRQGDNAGAAAIINVTRTTNGQLPAITGDEPDFFKWLKYEKKIETFSTPGLAFFDRRGWTGDAETGQDTELVAGTPIHFPVPAKELEVSLLDVYSHGGSTGNVAPRKTGMTLPFTQR